MSTVLEEIHKIVERLPLTYQQRVLEFVQSLTQTDQTLNLCLSLQHRCHWVPPAVPYYKCASSPLEKMLKQWSVL